MLRKRGESAWRLAPALWAVFLLLSATAAAQEVPLVAAQAPSSCSAGVPPSPPTGLRTKPAGDGSVRLEWAAPANRACVKEYQVSVFPLGGPRAAATPIQKTPVSAFNLTVVGLENNIEHRFFVRAVGSDATGWPMPGGEAQVTATPTAACSAGLLPTAPTNLTAQPLAAGGGIRLCWGPPDNSACVDDYRVAVTPQASGLKGGQRASPRYLRTSSGACMNVTGLENGQPYLLYVQAWSAEAKGGAYATVAAAPVAPPQAWRCQGVAGYYQLCSAAARGACPALSCVQQVARGQCNASFMRFVDVPSRQIFQYCADVCGCNPDPQLGRSGPIADAPAAAEAQGAEPRVRAFDAVTALTAARSPSVAWDWECCAVKPARPESIGEEQEA